MTTHKIKPNRILNDLIESSFKTPKGMEFVKYGKRRDADYKMSKKPNSTEHLIEVVWRGKYESQTFSTLEEAYKYLTKLCVRFKEKKAA